MLVSVRLLLEPLTATLKVPVGVDVVVVTVIVEVPLPLMELGLKLAVELDGKLRALSDTVPLKPLIAVTVTV